MRLIILILLFPILLIGQHFFESFNSFIPDTSRAGIVGSYFNTPMNTDHAGAHNLTTINSFGDSVRAISPLVNGEDVVYVRGTAADQSLTYSDDIDFRPKSQDFSISMLVMFDHDDYAGVPVSSWSAMYYFRMSNSGNSGPGFYSYLYDGSGDYSNFTDIFPAGVDSGKWVYIVYNADISETDASIYVNGTFVSGGGGWATTNTLSGLTYPIVQNSTFRIGDLGPANQHYQGYIAYVAYDSTALTSKQIKEDVYLADGWFSKNGGVARGGDLEFNQGIVNDTVYVNLTDSTLASGTQWTLTWRDSVAGGTWQSRSYNFTENLSSDSLFFSTTGNNLTVYTDGNTIATTAQGTTTVFIDDVSLTVTTASSTIDKHLNHKNRLNRLVK